MSAIFSTLRFIANHPLASRDRLGAYLRYGRWQIESRLRDEVEYDWVEGAKLIAKNGMTGATGNIYCGLHEFADMAFLLHLLRPDDLFVEVGANIGSYSILASAVCKSRSIAVEPDPVTVQSLRRNLIANKIEDRVTVVEAAVGASEGRAAFTIGRDTTNQIVENTTDQTRFVEVRLLDSILDSHSPILIKMDVEGYEDRVISGALRTLDNPKLMAVITENADLPVRDVLVAHGFCVATYEPFSRSLDQIVKQTAETSGNTLFVRDLATCRARIEAAPVRVVAGQHV